MPSHQCYLGVRLLNSLAHLALKGKVQILDDDADKKVAERLWKALMDNLRLKQDPDKVRQTLKNIF